MIRTVPADWDGSALPRYGYCARRQFFNRRWRPWRRSAGSSEAEAEEWECMRAWLEWQAWAETGLGAHLCALIFETAAVQSG